MARIDSQNDMFCQINDSCVRVKEELVEGATNRMFEVGDKFILFNYRNCVVDLVWSRISYLLQMVKKIACNRASCKISFVSYGIRKASSITCGYSWRVRLKAVEYGKYANADQVVITTICGVHSNTYDSSYRDQFVLAWTHSGDYKKCADQSLEEVMAQMDIEYFVSIRAIR